MQGGPEDTDERVLALHTIHCRVHEERSHFLEEGHDVERVTEMMPVTTSAMVKLAKGIDESE